METKKSKYDTNPLDPNYVKNAEQSWGAEGDAAARPETQEVRGATREIGSTANENARANVYSEAPTRRYDNPPLEAPYPSIFVPPTYSQPAPYQPPPAPYRPVTQRPPGSRTVAGIGFPEKWASALPYAPFYIGIIVSLVELFLVPRREVRVRFHAAQGLALQIAMVVGQTVFGVIAKLTGSSFGGTLFGLFCFIFLIVSVIRVCKGEPHHIAPLTDAGQWLNQRIEPRNKS